MPYSSLKLARRMDLANLGARLILQWVEYSLYFYAYFTFLPCYNYSFFRNNLYSTSSEGQIPVQSGAVLNTLDIHNRMHMPYPYRLIRKLPNSIAMILQQNIPSLNKPSNSNTTFYYYFPFLLLYYFFNLTINL